MCPIWSHFLWHLVSTNSHFASDCSIYIMCKVDVFSPFFVVIFSLLLFFYLFFILSLPRPKFCTFAWKSPCTGSSYLIILLCSCACSALPILPKIYWINLWTLSNEEILESYFLGMLKRIFCIIRSCGKSIPSNLTLFIMLSNWSRVFFDVFCIFYLPHFKLSNQNEHSLVFGSFIALVFHFKVLLNILYRHEVHDSYKYCA